MPRSLNALAQRWGRAARDPSTQAIVVLFAEPDYFQEVREAKAAKKAAKQKKASINCDGAMQEIENELLQVAEVGRPRKRRRIDALAMYTSDPVEPEGDQMLQADPSTPRPFRDTTLLSTPHPTTKFLANMLTSLKDPRLTASVTKYTPRPRSGKRGNEGKADGRDSMKTKTKAEAEIEPALDDLVNAQHLPADDPRQGCLRKVLDSHYGNDSLRMCT